MVSGDFLIYVSTPNMIHYYSLRDQSEMNEFRHSIAIRAVYPNIAGTRVVAIDTSGVLFVYSPVNDECVSVPDFPSHVKTILWDVMDPSCFMLSDGIHNPNCYSCL